MFLRKIYVNILAFIAVFTFSLTGIFAQNIDDLKRQQSEILDTQRETNEKLEETTEQKNEAISEMQKLDIELIKALHELDRVDKELQNTQKLLEETEQELADARKLREKQYETFKERLVIMYENGDTGYLDIVLEARDFMDLITKIEYINYIAEFDNEIIEKLKATEELISQKIDEINKHKSSVQILLIEQTIKKENLEDKIEEKNEFISSLRNDEEKYNQQIKELEESSQNIAEMIRKAEEEEARRIAEEKRRAEEAARSQNTESGNTNNYYADDSIYDYGGGTLANPVPGYSYISSGYGNRTLNGRYEFHGGIDIPAPMGTNVVAAESGVVISSGWQDGYGYTVVIGHGNGMSTLYAHNSTNLVSSGQEVSRGQVIALVGSTGYSTGPHVHFEVRINGSHVNPRNYVNI